MKSRLYLQILTLFISSFFQGQNGAGNWIYAGPGETSEQVKGMIKSLWVDEANPSFVLAGSSSGGLFKCENADDKIPVWQNISDTYKGVNFGISDIVVIPGTGNKTIFVATGHNSGLPIGYGNGILKTSDGGNTWEEIGPKARRKNLFMIDGLVSNPQNPSEMIAYTQKEIFLTRNKWQSFERVLLPVDSLNNNISFCDVEFAPFEPGKFYVCTRTYNYYDARLFVCSNYGKQVNDITPKEKQSERIEIETINTEKQKGKFYAAYGNANVYACFFNGNAFTTLNALPVNQFYAGAFWNLEFVVHPSDTSLMYVGMTEISRSTNGGKTFEKIATYNGRNTHADVRALYLLKNSSNGKQNLYIGNDGGVSLLESENPVSWKNLNGRGLNANQFWGADVAQSDTLLIAGGAQDNGSFLISAKGIENTMSGCGDGYLGLVIDEHSAITQCNPPGLYYHNLKTKQFSYIQVNDTRCETKRPMLMVDSFVYIGYHQVWKMQKNKLKAGQVEVMQASTVPDVKDPNGGLRNEKLKSISIGNQRSAVVAYSNPNWESKDNNGKLFFCKDIDDKDQTWTDITGLAIYNTMSVCRWFEIISLEIHLDDPFSFYFVAEDPFNQNNCLLFKATYLPDSGKCILKQLNANLDKVGINKIKTDKFTSITYLACDDGVYFADLKKDSLWQKLNAEKELPSVIVSDIAFNYANNTLLVATYGRGLWQSTMVSGSQTKTIGTTSILNEPYKIDGKLIVAKKREITLNDKVIITKGSVIELKKGSVLRVKKNLVRDENNKLIDLDLFVRKNKGAKIIYR